MKFVDQQKAKVRDFDERIAKLDRGMSKVRDPAERKRRLNERSKLAGRRELALLRIQTASAR